MCTILGADYLLATILSNRNRVSIAALWNVRTQIHSRVPSVAVDISTPAVNAALQHYPEIFEKEEDAIARGAKASEYLSSKYVDHEFTKSIPAEIHRIVKEIVAHSVP